MTGELENKLDKAGDTLGGTAGKMDAARTTDADGFVENAAIGDIYEIEAANIALDRSRDPSIHAIAKKMVADHTASTHHLQAALEMNETNGVIDPPKVPDARRKKMLQHLSEAPEDAFDKTYLDQQVLAHEETVSLMESYCEGGDNAQLRSVAQGNLPVVKRHLAHVKRARAST